MLLRVRLARDRDLATLELDLPRFLVACDVLHQLSLRFFLPSFGVDRYTPGMSLVALNPSISSIPLSTRMQNEA